MKIAGYLDKQIERRRNFKLKVMHQDVFPILKKIPIFSPLTENVLSELAEKAKTVQFPKNAIILHQGELSNSLHIILSGKIRVYVSDEENEFILQTQEAGSYFGELALITNSPRSASVKTLEKTVCGVISQADFRQWINRYPEVSALILQSMAEKVLQLTDEIQTMALLMRLPTSRTKTQAFGA